MNQLQNRKLWFDGIDAFLFDLGRVLLDFSHEQMMERMAVVTGIAPSMLRHHLLEERLLHKLESGQISDGSFLTILRASATKPFIEQDLRIAMADIFTPIAETVDLLPQLIAAGKRLVLVSNTSAIHFDHELQVRPWLSSFHAYILSYQIGHMKPAAEFYTAALAAARTSPERCLFVDDIAENIAGAKKAGFQTHHFTDGVKFRQKFPWS